MNPFSLPISDQELYLAREEQRLIERSITEEQRLVPLHLRKVKLPIQMLGELRRIASPLEPSTEKKNKRSHSYNRENILELILRKREILLTKKKIEHKKHSISLLDSITRNREEEHKKAAKSLEDNYLRVEKYEESLKADAKKKADLAEKQVKLRLEKQLEMNILEQDIEKLYGRVERNAEELKHLTVFKEFVEELTRSNESNTSLIFVTQNMDDVYTPSFLLKSIDALEQKNLFLIQQAQEGEQGLENLRSIAQSEGTLLESHNSGIKTKIKQIEKQKEFTISKLSNLLNERVEKPLVTEETMKIIHEKLIEIYMMIGGDSVVLPSDFEILENLENSIRAEQEKAKLLGEDELKQIEKQVEKDRRFKNVEVLKQKEIEKAKEISQKLDRRNRKVNKRTGRKAMERSKIPERAEETEKVMIPQEILDRREFLEEFIPYP